MKLVIHVLVMLAILSPAVIRAQEKLAYQNWIVDLNTKTNEAHTVADANTSFGMFCASEQCLFYLHQSLNCTPGAKYSVLMNSPSISTALSMECTLINGNVFQILTPFNAVLQAIQAGEGIGFAVALQSGAFAVTRFSLQGAKPAIDRVLTEAATSKSRAQKPPPAPPIQQAPPVIIMPNNRINPGPNSPAIPSQKPPVKDISI